MPDHIISYCELPDIPSSDYAKSPLWNTECLSIAIWLTGPICRVQSKMNARVITSVFRKFSSIFTILELGLKSTCLQSVIQSWSKSKLRWKIFSLSPDIFEPCLTWGTNIINMQSVEDVSYCVPYEEGWKIHRCFSMQSWSTRLPHSIDELIHNKLQ